MDLLFLVIRDPDLRDPVPDHDLGTPAYVCLQCQARTGRPSQVLAGLVKSRTLPGQGQAGQN